MASVPAFSALDDISAANLTLIWQTPDADLIHPNNWTQGWPLRDVQTEEDRGDDIDVEEGAGGNPTDDGGGVVAMVEEVEENFQLVAQQRRQEVEIHYEEITFSTPRIPALTQFTASASIAGMRSETKWSSTMFDGFVRGLPRAYSKLTGVEEESFVPFSLIEAEQRRARIIQATKAFAENFPRASPHCKISCVASPISLTRVNSSTRAEGNYTLGCWETGHRNAAGTRNQETCPTKSWGVQIVAEEREE